MEGHLAGLGAAAPVAAGADYTQLGLVTRVTP